MYNDLMISVDELWLKGRNRPLYFRAITKHIDMVIKSYHSGKFFSKNNSQRLSYTFENPVDDKTILAICNVPGIAIISPVRVVERTENDEEDLNKAFIATLEECSFFNIESKTFRASVKRIDKRFKISSVDLEHEIGKKVLEKYPNARANLRHPEIILDIRVLPNKITISSKSFKGIGGLPWDTSGSAVTMLSGGFDSPVASFMMSKRGMKQSFVFFYAYPFVGTEVLDKIKNLTKELAKFNRQSHLYIVPFGDIQNLIAKSCKEEYRTIFFRKFMVRATNIICEKIGAEAIITGDSLGQVSSQTLLNMSLIDKSSDRIILRPLLGFNKIEVLKLAEKIGTHDISILPHDDACALFAPENPIIRPNINYWDAFDKEFDFSNDLLKAVNSAEVYSVNLIGELYKKEFFSYDS